MNDIVQNLQYLKYVKVTGMKEIIGGVMINTIKKGTPLTWDWNKGVVVVYDSAGDPWIKKETFQDFRFPNLKQGAYVPFSNDPKGLNRLFPPKSKGLLA